MSHEGTTQSSPQTTTPASPGDAAGPGNASPAADTAGAAQPSYVSTQTATAGKAASAAEAREGAHAELAPPGKKSKRKRQKVQQQQAADATGHAPEPVQAGSCEAPSDGASTPDLGKTKLHCSPGAIVQTAVPVPSPREGLEHSPAEPDGSEARPDGTSAEVPRQDGRLSAQQEQPAEALSTLGDQTSPRASSRRKSVRFHLRDNLFFEPGGQVPPAAVRTPPKARPKVCLIRCWIEEREDPMSFAQPQSVACMHAAAVPLCLCAGQCPEGGEDCC
jgi:hypothetical protein